MSREGELHSVQFMNYSAVESKRFGMRVFRGSMEQVDSDSLLAALLENSVDIAILRLPSEKQYQLFSLELLGIPYIVADTLVVYELDLQLCPPQSMRNEDLEFVECTVEDTDILDTLVQEIFVDYTNHYYSNPLLEKRLILEGYKEWARAYVGGQPEGRTAWVVRKKGRPIAFVTCRFEGDVCEVILNGVTPSEAGRGVYGDIVRFAQAHFKSKTYSKMMISTQVQNYPVQKVWSQNRFILKKSFATIHINALLHASKAEAACIEIALNEAGSEPNRVGVWKAAFDVVAEHSAAVYAGFDTQLFGFRCRSLRPMPANRVYRCHFSKPIQLPGTSFHKAVMRVSDSQDEIHLLAYLDLYQMKR